MCGRYYRTANARSLAEAFEAEPLYARALSLRERALSPEHPDTATSLHNLALVYEKGGRYAEAEPQYRRAVRIRERAFGPEHPYTAASVRAYTQLKGSSATGSRQESWRHE
jgi:tetratricopeptide (TPR) repeat protein